VVWTATLVSNVGIWMQNAASGWLMTSLAPDPRAVAMVQVASALPMFLMGLPAGALADLFDRRRLLLAMEIVGTLLTVALAALLTLDRVTPGILLGFIFPAEGVPAAHNLAAIGALLAIPALRRQKLQRSVHPDLTPSMF
jgi:MFS family permease